MMYLEILSYFILIGILLISVFMSKKVQSIYLAVIIILFVILTIYLYSKTDPLETKPEEHKVYSDFTE